ncbi:MAG: dihydropteroate synthase [Bacteroidales bacterium]|nr:dihydropteroate synthase [Bacteroidales bacterium]
MLRIASREQIFSWDRPVVMGIMNVTPDSFFDGGKYQGLTSVLEHCQKMVAEGADILDLGAFSTRPGSERIFDKEEIERIIPALKAIRKEFPNIPISIDTFRQSVAAQCIAEGADIINDISGGLFDEAMIPYIGKNHIPYILMHITGTLEGMHHEEIISEDVHEKVRQFLENQVNKLLEYGEQQIILDPGIGFNKTIECNFALLRDLDKYRVNGLPILIGISRKSLIYKTLGFTPQEALNGTTVLNTIALMNGAEILRVHDVKEAVEAVKLTHSVISSEHRTQ